MKILLAVCLVCLFALCTAAPAKAECPPYTTLQYAAAWTCGDFGYGYTCYQIVTACINPDGSVAAYGDAWSQLAVSYQASYGGQPDAEDLETYYLLIC